MKDTDLTPKKRAAMAVACLHSLMGETNSIMPPIINCHPQGLMIGMVVAMMLDVMETSDKAGTMHKTEKLLMELFTAVSERGDKIFGGPGEKPRPYKKGR